MFEVGKRYRAENGSVWEIIELNINRHGQMRGLRISSITPTECDDCVYIPETTHQFHRNGKASSRYTLQPEPINYLSEAELRETFNLLSQEIFATGHTVKFDAWQQISQKGEYELLYWCHIETRQLSISASNLHELFQKLAKFKSS